MYHIKLKIGRQPSNLEKLAFSQESQKGNARKRLANLYDKKNILRSSSARHKQEIDGKL
jgi:hypothetical protein